MKKAICSHSTGVPDVARCLSVDLGTFWHPNGTVCKLLSPFLPVLCEKVIFRAGFCDSIWIRVIWDRAKGYGLNQVKNNKEKMNFIFMLIFTWLGPFNIYNYFDGKSKIQIGLQNSHFDSNSNWVQNIYIIKINLIFDESVFPIAY